MAKYITAQVCACTSKDKQMLIIIIIMITLSPLQFPERRLTTVDRQEIIQLALFGVGRAGMTVLLINMLICATIYTYISHQ